MERKIKHYVLAANYDITKFNTLVNSFIEKGYELYGNPDVTCTSAMSNYHRTTSTRDVVLDTHYQYDQRYIQALVLYQEDRDDSTNQT